MTDIKNDIDSNFAEAITPSQGDIDVVEKQYLPLPPDATAEQHAERYRLYQAQALIRLSLAGDLSFDVMRVWTTSR